ncbi:MAG: VWA domain-containing protein [Proteobacteria bacterium]|nr:VWA domain-containing protein [Pseudomonadota bacterium]
MNLSRTGFFPRLFLCAGVAFISLASAACSGEKATEFLSAKAAPTPFGAKALGAEMMGCPDKSRPLRVAFVIDNTRSNSETPGIPQSGDKLQGSDPIRNFAEQKYLLDDPDFKNLNTDGLYTNRQFAVYKAIRRLQRAGLEARASNPDYKGMDVGISHFPLAPKYNRDDKEKSSPTEEQMKNAVFHFGENTGLKSKMTDISVIEESAEFSQNIWNTLKFTHHPNGMTPYLTAFSAANTLLNEEKKEGDPRQGVMVLVTDGLPTDRSPSKIKKARKNLGKENRVVLLQVYGDGEISDESQNQGPKSVLEGLFTGPLKWGLEEHSSFANYWKALLAIPASPEVRDDQIQVNSSKLNESLDGMLKYILNCNQN